MPTDSSAVLEERRGDVVTITLDRPEKRNALAVDVMETRPRPSGGPATPMRSASSSPPTARCSPPVTTSAIWPAPRRGSAACLRRVHRDDDDDPGAPPAGMRTRPCPGNSRRLPTGRQLRPRGSRRVRWVRDPGGQGGLFCHTPLVAVARSIGRKRASRWPSPGTDRRRHRRRLGLDQPCRCPTTCSTRRSTT